VPVEISCGIEGERRGWASAVSAVGEGVKLNVFPAQRCRFACRGKAENDPISVSTARNGGAVQVVGGVKNQSSLGAAIAHESVEQVFLPRSRG